MNPIFRKIFLGLPFLLVVFTISDIHAFEISDDTVDMTHELSLTDHVTLTDNVELSTHDTIPVSLFDSLLISNNEISIDGLVERIYDDKFTIGDSFEDSKIILKESISIFDTAKTKKVLSLSESVTVSDFAELSHTKLLSSPIGDMEP